MAQNNNSEGIIVLLIIMVPFIMAYVLMVYAFGLFLLILPLIVGIYWLASKWVVKLFSGLAGLFVWDQARDGWWSPIYWQDAINTFRELEREGFWIFKYVIECLPFTYASIAVLVVLVGGDLIYGGSAIRKIHSILDPEPKFDEQDYQEPPQFDEPDYSGQDFGFDPSRFKGDRSEKEEKLWTMAMDNRTPENERIAAMNAIRRITYNPDQT